jgi:hypothetical protein
MQDEKFDLSQEEFLQLTGRSRATVFEYRRAGLPAFRDPQTGRIFFRRSDAEKVRQWKKPTVKDLFNTTGE